MGIKSLEQHEVYKYLGLNEHDGEQQRNMKTKLNKEYYRKVRKVLQRKLTSKNKLLVITSLAVPYTYIYNIVLVSSNGLRWKSGK